jgi:hypothetical protein
MAWPYTANAVGGVLSNILKAMVWVKGLLVSQLFAVADDLCAVAVLEYRGLV